MDVGARAFGVLGLMSLLLNLISMPFESGAIQPNLHYSVPSGDHTKSESLNTTSQIALANPSFENGFENWFRNGPCNTVTYSGSALHGNWYLASNRNGTEACSSIYQDKTYSVQNSEHYRLAVWVRSANGTPLYGTVALWGLGQNPNQNAKTHFNTAGTGWQCVETIFKPEENHTSLRAEFYVRSLNGEYHFDNVMLSKESWSDEPTSLCPNIPLQNPSFEQGTQGWSASAPCYIGTASDYMTEGTYYLVANRNGSESCYSVSQDTSYPIKAGRIYRVATWVRSPSGVPLNGTIALWGLGQNPNENGSANFTVSGIGWQCVEAVFRPNNNHSTFRTEFYLKSMGGDYHFDDVIVREQATSLCPTIPLRNPSFEQGIEGWSASAPCYLNRGTNAAFDGTGYLVANRNGSESCYSVSQDTRDIQTMHYGVGGNHTYRLAAWVRSPSGAALNGTLALWGLGWNPNENASTNFITTGTGWQCVEVIFRPVYDHLDFRAEIYLKSMNGDYHFDGITIREQATPLCP
ncbi:MAG: carbohydrate binding domain-containing protein [Chloroflexi bacterium]|nr:carbohydrate binding domain-containing protein [Chloroflexota bacterium]